MVKKIDEKIAELEKEENDSKGNSANDLLGSNNISNLEGMDKFKIPTSNNDNLVNIDNIISNINDKEKEKNNVSSSVEEDDDAFFDDFFSDN